MEITPEQEALLRRIFRYLNKFMLSIWRLGLGGFGNPTKLGGAVMVIKHTGWRTGLTRYAPVNYAIIDGDVYCTAAMGERTHWYRNIIAQPEVELWLPDSRWVGTAEDVSELENRAELLRKILIASGFAAPLFGVNPRKFSDEELDKLVDRFRLIRIQRDAPMTGPGGPGDLAWIWPLSTFLLLVLLLFPKRRRR